MKAGTFTYADLIRMAADLGADGVDLTTYWLPDTKDETLFALKKLAYRCGVSIYTIGVRARMAQPTAELQTAEVELVRKWLDVAQRLGASHMRIFGGAIPKGATEAQAIAMAVETLKRCAVEAEAKGITLGVEDDGGITTNAGPTVEIVKKAASPWVGINLDTGNFPGDAYAQIELCAPYATNVHFKSEVHTAVGHSAGRLAAHSRHSGECGLSRLPGAGIRIDGGPDGHGSETDREDEGSDQRADSSAVRIIPRFQVTTAANQ